MAQMSNLVYKAFYRSKQPIEIRTAHSSYEAQCRAAELWDLKPSQRCNITVVLVSKDGEPVVHRAVD